MTNPYFEEAEQIAAEAQVARSEGSAWQDVLLLLLHSLVKAVLSVATELARRDS